MMWRLEFLLDVLSDAYGESPESDDNENDQHTYEIESISPVQFPDRH